MPHPLTPNQVTAFRLARHHLLQPSPPDALTSVARDIAGAQAQVLSAAQISLACRLDDTRLADVADAIDRRALVRAACMRRTLFLVPAQDLAVFARGTTGRAEKGIRWARGKGVPDDVLDEVIDATLDALDRPRTRAQIAQRVGQSLGLETESVHGGGWGSRSKVPAVPVAHLTFPATYLLHLAAARGVICYGPDGDDAPTFVRAGAWIPQWQDMPREQAESALLRLYLRAFAPATPRDFSLWTGLTLTEARHIWAREKANLATVDVEGRQATVLRDDLPQLAGAQLPPRHIRLLPYFDTFLLGHKDREHLVASDHQPHVYRPQGWVSPVLLVDGRVAGVWKHTNQGDRLRVEVTPFQPQPAPISTAIHEQAQNLAHILAATNLDLQIQT